MGAKAVRQSVATFKGNVTWEYSQSDWATLKIIATNSVSRFGICKALSAQWIVDHAYGGSLVSRMVGANGKLNETAIRKIKAHFIDASGPGKDQRRLTEQWLLARGLLRRHTSFAMPGQDRSGKATFKPMSAPRDIARAPANGRDDAGQPLAMANFFRTIAARESRVRMGGSYCQIDFDGPSSGHAVAAWIAQDALFFDPNNGEYWFEDANDFCAWYPTFYANAGYASWPFKMLRGWHVEEYALGARWKSEAPRR